MKKSSFLWLFLCMVYGGGILAYEEESSDHLNAPSFLLQAPKIIPREAFPKSLGKAFTKADSYKERYWKSVKKYEETLEEIEQNQKTVCDNPITTTFFGGHYKRLISFDKTYANPNHHFSWYKGLGSLPKIGVLYSRIAGDLILIPIPALTIALPASLMGCFIGGSKGGKFGFLGGAAVGGAIGKFISFTIMTPIGGLAGLVAAPLVIPASKLYYKINAGKKIITSHQFANQLMATGKKIMKQKPSTDLQEALNRALEGICHNLDYLKDHGAVPKKTTKFLEKTSAYLKENAPKYDLIEIKNMAKETTSSSPQDPSEMTPDGKSSPSQSSRHLSSHIKTTEESESDSSFSNAKSHEESE